MGVGYRVYRVYGVYKAHEHRAKCVDPSGSVDPTCTAMQPALSRNLGAKLGKSKAAFMIPS